MSDQSYAELEKRTLALLNGTPRKRINARLQAAYNYAISSELQMGTNVSKRDLAEAIVDATVAIMRNAEQTLPPGALEMMTRMIAAQIAIRAVQPAGDIIGRVTIPTQEGHT